MPEIHLRKPGFMCSACKPFRKSKTNTQIQRNKRFEIYLSEETRKGLLST